MVRYVLYCVVTWYPLQHTYTHATHNTPTHTNTHQQTPHTSTHHTHHTHQHTTHTNTHQHTPHTTHEHIPQHTPPLLSFLFCGCLCAHPQQNQATVARLKTLGSSKTFGRQATAPLNISSMMARGRKKRKRTGAPLSTQAMMMMAGMERRRRLDNPMEAQRPRSQQLSNTERGRSYPRPMTR